MIGPLIELAARRSTMADAALKTDETTSITIADGRATRAGIRHAQGVNLRVLVDGHAGFAGSSEDQPVELLETALASAQVGEVLQLALPRQSVLPGVTTHSPRAAAATSGDLLGLATLLRDRLAGDRAELSLTVERSLGSVRVANTNGLDAGYDISRVSLAVQVSRVLAGRRLVLQGHLSGSDMPGLAEVERLVSAVRARLAWAEREVEPPTGRTRVGFLPAALPVLLLPLEQALLGKTAIHGLSPVAQRRGSRMFSEMITLRDDPLVDGRPGSRPVDDEGVGSRVVPLVQAGVVEGLLYDLETAARAGVESTGHGRRSTFAKPQPAASNLVLEPGTASWQELLTAVGDGLLVEETRGTRSSNVVGGTFAQPASVAWRVQGGEITGLVPEVTIAGNAYDLLGRVIALGNESVWLGSRAAPIVAVEGASVF